MAKQLVVCLFCGRDQTTIPDEETMVQSGNASQGICSICIPQCQALCAASARKKGWKKSTKLSLVK